MKLYFDTSVFGGYFDEEFEFWTRPLFAEVLDGRHQIVVSGILIAELERAPSNVRNYFNEFPPEHYVIKPLDEEVRALAQHYLDEKVIPPKFETDALHIACATIERVDIIVSWNFKHMVNVTRIRGYNSVNLRNDYPEIDIRSPKELYNEKEI